MRELGGGRERRLRRCSTGGRLTWLAGNIPTMDTEENGALNLVKGMVGRNIEIHKVANVGIANDLCPNIGLKNVSAIILWANEGPGIPYFVGKDWKWIWRPFVALSERAQSDTAPEGRTFSTPHPPSRAPGAPEGGESRGRLDPGRQSRCSFALGYYLLAPCGAAVCRAARGEDE